MLILRHCHRGFDDRLSDWLWVESNNVAWKHLFLALDAFQKQVQNQVFSCSGKKTKPLNFNESDTRYESRFPLQDSQKSHSDEWLFCAWEMFASCFRPILLKKSAMVSAAEKYASDIEIFTFGWGVQRQISRSRV
ncbi:hypothetical protein [Pseudomonas brassicacearum]|uniref:hypothetical protein n=1 Tax=Pseudomonas brassicacearum TaxID=930166 RepID=UPI003CEC21F5